MRAKVAQTNHMLIRKRITILFFLIAAVLFSLILRVTWIQLIRGCELQQKALEIRLRDIPVEARRGTIYDRNGKELVTSVSADSIVAFPPQIKNPHLTAKKLAPVLKMEENKVFRILSKRSSFQWVKKKVDFETSQKVKQLKLRGISFVEGSQRYYKNGALAAHVLGFTGDDNQGLTGLEKTFDHELKGIPGRIVVEYDAAGREVPDALHRYVKPMPGKSLILTIDETIQYFVERELDNIVDTYQPENAVIIAMNPQNGEIMAMGSRPTFKPSDWKTEAKSIWNFNPATWYNYEPGSTFKIITAAAALEEGTVKSTDRFYDPGYIKVADRRIRCWKDGGHGSQSFEEVVQNSCNPGFVQVGLELGKERFYKYINAFGFGQKTGVELPGEAEGIIIPEQKATNLNIANMAIGQSISVTPIQLVTAVSAVANGGLLLKPHLVKAVLDSNQKIVREYKPEPIRRVISQEADAKLIALLENVINKGTGKNAFVEGYRAAGKTGTAQVVGAGGRYLSDKHIASFIGFAPVQNPQVVVLVMVNDPKGGIYFGSQVAAPVFGNLTRDILRYLMIPEEAGLQKPKLPYEITELPKKVEVPLVANFPVNEAQKVLNNVGLTYQLTGKGDLVYQQIPKEGTTVLKSTRIILKLKPTINKNGEITLPNLKGMSLKEVGTLLEKLDLIFLPKGSGLAAKQEPQAGTKLIKGEKVKVEFQPPKFEGFEESRGQGAEPESSNP